MSEPSKSTTGCTGCNPCSDQNGIIICQGGYQQVVPFPTTGTGPWTVSVDIDPATGLPRVVFANVLSAPAPAKTDSA